MVTAMGISHTLAPGRFEIVCDIGCTYRPWNPLYRPKLFNLSTIDIWGHIILHYGAVPCIVGCWASYLVATNRTPIELSPLPISNCVNLKVSRHCQISPNTVTITPIEKHCYRNRNLNPESPQGTSGVAQVIDAKPELRSVEDIMTFSMTAASAE
jgi:hypothetical protein